MIQFQQTLQIWQSALDRYSESALTITPHVGWSAGQLYLHLIDSTNWFLDQAEACIGNTNAQQEQMKDAAKRMFVNNSFPDLKIKGDPLVNDTLPQPASKAYLVVELNKLGTRASAFQERLATNPVFGKSAHPGLGYFNPHEWLQYSEMHMRHHLRQKERIDSFILSQ